MDILKISRNDPGLAHALAKRELHRVNAVNEKIVQRVYRDHRRSLKQSFKALRGVFGALVIIENIDRPVGSRASGSMLVLDNVDSNPEQMLLALFGFNARAGGLQTPLDCGIKVQLHTIARTMQRSVGSADIQAVATLIKPHLIRAMSHVVALIKKGSIPAIGTKIRVVSPTGMLCFTVEPGKLAPFTLLARTWISAERARGPQLIKAIERAHQVDGCVVLTDKVCN